MVGFITVETFSVPLKVTYPCCGGRARFIAICVVPIETYSRSCPNCGKRWEVRRETMMRLKDGSRADKLEWEPARRF